jgi:hypothetical protein
MTGPSIPSRAATIAAYLYSVGAAYPDTWATAIATLTNEADQEVSMTSDTRTLDPEWAAPGPSLYKTMLDEAHRDALDDLALLITDLLAPAVRKEAFSRLYAAMSRLYVRGVAEGYSQAARAFDSRPDDKSGTVPYATCRAEEPDADAFAQNQGPT